MLKGGVQLTLRRIQVRAQGSSRIRPQRRVQIKSSKGGFSHLKEKFKKDSRGSSIAQEDREWHQEVQE
jgi:hypothetical protein